MFNGRSDPPTFVMGSTGILALAAVIAHAEQRPADWCVRPNKAAASAAVAGLSVSAIVPNPAAC
jgi:hypothetical protein